VVTAANGKEALELALPSPPDTIISDILMPVMDGFHLCREVRADETLRNTHFIFYTATYRERRDQELAMKLGADAFLVKPMDPAEFITAVKGAMEKEVNKGSSDPEPEVEVLRLYNERQGLPRVVMRDCEIRELRDWGICCLPACPLRPQ